MSTTTKLTKLISRSLTSLGHLSSTPSIPYPYPPPISTLHSSSSSSQTLTRSIFPKCLPSHFTTARTRGNMVPTEMAPLFPGCDYNHWLIVMDKPGGDGATKHQMIDCYVQTLAKVLGSEEEARRKIYNVSCERYFGFGCEVEEETANKMEDFPGVLFVLPDSYVDPENQDYGAELFVNGEIVQRSPERQRRVEPQPQRDRHRPNSPRPRRRM